MFLHVYRPVGSREVLYINFGMVHSMWYCISVVGYSESRITELKQALQEAGFDSWKTVIGTRGVTLHTEI